MDDIPIYSTPNQINMMSLRTRVYYSQLKRITFENMMAVPKCYITFYVSYFKIE